MNKYKFEFIKDIKTVAEATEYLFTHIERSPSLDKALKFAFEAHKTQKRKSGEPYIIHPILVAAIVAIISEDTSMVQAALLHDVVEDTHYTIEDIIKYFGDDVAHLVEGLTKIDDIRDENLVASNSNEKLIVSALSFRKMLLASIKDVRVLVVKLCDRLHNMLTLDALNDAKQLRISEETLVVYAPIAHRLGISYIKNLLEDLSFRYLFKDDVFKINTYLKENYESIELRLNAFEHKLTQIFLENGFCSDDFELVSRVKHTYSIYLKMQRKGVGIDEVLDLLAVRVIVKDELACYKVLGLTHLNFQPLASRFKDYIAIAKDNGYQTIHTSVFSETSIFEVQIRTKKMHETAELGVAAHWKYKNAGNSNVNLDWLQNLQYQNESVEDFYELIKNDLYSEDISVFSPQGKPYTLPRGARVLDFAYAVHTEIGKKAEYALVNKEKASLLSEIHNGDIVKIILAENEILRCSWMDAIKTSKAKSSIKNSCNQRIKSIDIKSTSNILSNLLNISCEELNSWLDSNISEELRQKAVSDNIALMEILNRYYNEVRPTKFAKFISWRPTLKKFTFGALEFMNFKNVSSVVFDYCCHPKTGDEIVAFYSSSKAHVHHKLCSHALSMMDKHEPMIFTKWVRQSTYHYHLIVSMTNAQGSLAEFLTYLAKEKIDIISIELGTEKGEHIQLCEMEFQSIEADINRLKSIIDKKIKIIQFIRTDDAYRSI